MKADLRIKLGASGILIRDGKVLLGLREGNDDQLPGLWCTPGGGVETGETLVKAIKREFLEETGLCICVYKVVSIQELITDGSHNVLIFMLVGNTSHDPKAKDGFEIVQFFSRKEVEELQTLGRITPATYAALQEFLIGL